jgi:hypothetical protein
MFWNNQRHNAIYAALTLLSYTQSEERYYILSLNDWADFNNGVKTRSDILSERL